MSPAGKVWRIGGVVITSALLYIALGEGLLMMAIFGFAGFTVFYVSWIVADRFDHWKDTE